MENFEKLGAFYLGRPYDLQTKTPKPGLLLYDSRDLVTHGVCVGMTGSGKTGLCIALLEEAAIDGIPSIVIDPKGDLANLMLTFPDLSPAEFAPWVNPEDAAKRNLSTQEYAAQQAELWRKGLGEWGQDGARIARLRSAADFRIYTPGSNSGIPVSILKSFAAPPAAARDDSELMSERVNTTITSLLGLLGIDSDPLRSREHILISNILSREWSEGRDLDIAALIQQIQSPSITRIGVMDLESFFPAKDRFELAMSLNNLLAAPAFSSWMEGDSLDVQNLLYGPNGKPQVSIFSIAHLSDSQRMFFVSLLLNHVLGWSRTQSGTTSLRAILYMDEIFGYFPPVANPPSKLPLLTLLKQGRAFGLGVLLVTQNPVDLDYKGLANAGTWFIGRLQTDRDKARVLEGLEGIAAGSGKKFDRQQMEQTLAGLGNRIFLLNNVHDDATEVFESRWAMSYLRGPLTRTQIKSVMDPLKQGFDKSVPAPTTANAPIAAPPVDTALAIPAATTQASRPVLPPEVTQVFIPVRNSSSDGTLVYHPMVLGMAEVHFRSKKIDATQDVTLLAPISDGAVAVDWDHCISMDIPASDLEQIPSDEARFSALPTTASKATSYEKWKKDFANWIYRNRKLELTQRANVCVGANAKAQTLGSIQLSVAIAPEKRDEAVESLRQKYAPKLAALEDRRLRAEQAVAREAEQAASHKTNTAISFGATLLSSFLGRKALSLTTLGRATTAARSASRSKKEAEDVERAQESLEVITQRQAELNDQFKSETEALEQSFDPQNEALETLNLKPTKANIVVQLLTLAWAPYWEDSKGQSIPAWD